LDESKDQVKIKVIENGKDDIDLTNEYEEKKSEPGPTRKKVVKQKPQVKFKLNDLQDLYDLVTIAKGGNPQAQQTLNNFLNFKDIIERSNFPDRRITRMNAFLKLASKTCYQDQPGTVFRDAYESVSSAFMGYKSKKSDQFVEMTKQTPTIAELTTGEPPKQRLRDRILGRKTGDD
jgi:hypothetical protein